MKKGFWVVLLVLLSIVAFAQEEKTIARYSDFPLDNIHILRLQEASMALGGNISDLKTSLLAYEQKRNKEIAGLREDMGNIRRELTAQTETIKASVSQLNNKVDKIQSAPALEVPAEVKYPDWLLSLLGVNIFLIIVVIVLIFWLREQYSDHKKEHEDHVHPAPEELISYVRTARDQKRKVADIRMELAQKGWSPSIIEHAIQGSRHKP